MTTTTAAPEPEEPVKSTRPAKERKKRSRRANRDGTISKRKDGRYEIKAYVLTTTGEEVRRTAYAKTYEEAQEKLAIMLADSHRGIPVAATRSTVGEYLSYWLIEIAQINTRPTTMQSYRSLVHRHLIPGLGRKRLDRLTTQDVRTWVNRFRTSCLCCSLGKDAARSENKRQCCAKPGGQCCQRHPSTRTVRYALVLLRAVLDQAVRDELIPRNVAKHVQAGQGSSREMSPLSAAEARAFLQTVREDRLAALFTVALALGLRRAEALGLRWEDIDVSAGTLQIRQTLHRVSGGLVLLPPKTASSRRLIALPAPCLAALRRHRAIQNSERLAAGEAWRETGLVFTTRRGTPIEPRNLNRTFEALCRKAGIRPVRLHDLRHTCATLLHAQGVDAKTVAEILGHSDVRITLAIYTHVAIETQRKALGGLDDLFG